MKAQKSNPRRHTLEEHRTCILMILCSTVSPPSSSRMTTLDASTSTCTIRWHREMACKPHRQEVDHSWVSKPFTRCG